MGSRLWLRRIEDIGDAGSDFVRAFLCDESVERYQPPFRRGCQSSNAKPSGPGWAGQLIARIGRSYIPTC